VAPSRFVRDLRPKAGAHLERERLVHLRTAENDARKRDPEEEEEEYWEDPQGFVLSGASGSAIGYLLLSLSRLA